MNWIISFLATSDMNGKEDLVLVYIVLYDDKYSIIIRICKVSINHVCIWTTCMKATSGRVGIACQ